MNQSNSIIEKSSTSKKLFRDTDNSYVGGVSAGLAHYFGIDVIWIRLIWFLLIFGAGTGVLLYILFMDFCSRSHYNFREVNDER